MQDRFLQPQARPGAAARIEAAYADQGPVGAAGHRAELRQAREDAKLKRKRKASAPGQGQGTKAKSNSARATGESKRRCSFDAVDTVVDMAKILLGNMDKRAKGPPIPKDHRIAVKTERGKRIFQVRCGAQVVCQVVEDTVGEKSQLLAQALVECHVLGFGKAELELGKRLTIKAASK